MTGPLMDLPLDLSSSTPSIFLGCCILGEFEKVEGNTAEAGTALTSCPVTYFAGYSRAETSLCDSPCTSYLGEQATIA